MFWLAHSWSVMLAFIGRCRNIKINCIYSEAKPLLVNVSHSVHVAVRKERKKVSAYVFYGRSVLLLLNFELCLA